MKSANTFKISLFYFFGIGLLFSACKKDKPPTGSHADVIYLESNQSGNDQNTILAYYDDGKSQLKAVSGSPFKTGGAGIGNPDQILGPDDQETPLIISDDRKYLFAVNPGSNTIAVFSINADGSLRAVTGSPFPSGGQTPQSLSENGQYLIVVNKAQDPLHPANQSPNYNVLKVSGDGSLTQLQGSTFETTPGTSPSQALVSNNKKFVFGTDFLGFMLEVPVGTLRSFTIGSGGLITPVAGTPYTIPGMGGSLGLWEHPSGNVLYVGFPEQGKVAAYTIDATSGALTFNTAVASGAAACWLRTNKSGANLYALNSAENTISVFNTSSPAAPTSIQKFTLKQSGPLYPGPMGAMFTTSQPFGLGFSKSEKYLYVVNQHTNKDFNVGNYNYLHVLEVGGSGMLSENSEPLQLPVINTVRPQGIAVF